MQTVTRSRRTLLELIPALRAGSDSERNVLWVITSLIAFAMSWSIVIDIVVDHSVMFANTTLLTYMLTALALSVIWTIVPMILKQRFPKLLATIGLFIVVVMASFNIGFSDHAVLATTAYHILPICALYLGWFWGITTAVLQFSFAMTLVIGGAVYSHITGTNHTLTVSTTVFALLLTVFAFVTGVYLRRRLTRKARTDQLTGVLNSRGIRQQLHTELVRARRQNEPLSIALLDFDGFKRINDTEGHVFGDWVLRSTVEHWQSQVRAYDRIGRIGGDEFLIVFPRTTKAEAERVLARLRREATHTWTWGVAECDGEDNVESMLARADEELYRFKSLRGTPAETARHTVLGEDRASNEEQRDVAQTRGFFSQLWHRQNEFSIGSMMFATVVFGWFMTALMVGDAGKVIGDHFVFGALALMIALAGVVIPLALGAEYPIVAGLANAGALLLLLTVLSLKTEALHDSIVLMFALSLVAAYLGTFSGSIASRLLITAGIVGVCSPVIIHGIRADHVEQEPVVIVTAIYSVLMCVLLFEVGATLYRRSRSHAHHDDLTGALNRHGMREYAVSEISRATRSAQPLSLVVLDCVGFKQVNDAHGHAAGDALLRKIARFFRSNLEMYDLIVRTGGDEFVLVLPYRTLADAIETVDTLVLASPNPLRYGIAQLEPGDTLDTLLARADLDLSLRV